MSNDYFTASGQPATGAFAASAPMRTEFGSIEDGFDKLPPLTANKAVVVNSAGTALVVTTGSLALAGDFSTVGAFSVALTATATTALTLPTTGTLATLAGTETFSNKTFGSNVALGTPVSGVATNLTGTAAGLTAGNVTTNANLTGPIASSGNATSITAQTGTGTTFVVQTSPTLVTPVLGVATATSINGLVITTTTGTITVTNGTTQTFPPVTASLGYINIPQRSVSAATTTVANDAGGSIYHPSADTTARIWTIDSNANVPYAVGTAITFINDASAGVITIAITSDVLMLAGTGATGSRTLGPTGMATAVKMTATRWIISGVGLA